MTAPTPSEAEIERLARAMCGPDRPHTIIINGRPAWHQYRKMAERILAAGYTRAEWQPIASAPKDGRHVLVVGGDEPQAVYEAYYEEYEDRGWYAASTHWTDAYDGSIHNVTAWQPLPSPPASDAVP